MFSGLLSALQIAIPTDPTQLLIWIVILLLIGLIIIALLGVLFAFPVAALVAILVWFLTGGDIFWAAVMFVIVALISGVIGRALRATHKPDKEKQMYGYKTESEPDQDEKS